MHTPMGKTNSPPSQVTPLNDLIIWFYVSVRGRTNVYQSQHGLTHTPHIHPPSTPDPPPPPLLPFLPLPSPSPSSSPSLPPPSLPLITLPVCNRIQDDSRKRFGAGSGEPKCNTDFCLWKREWYHVAGTRDPGGRATYPPLDPVTGGRIRSDWDRRVFSPGE